MIDPRTYPSSSQDYRYARKARRDPTTKLGIQHFKIPDAIVEVIAPLLLGGPCKEVPHEGKVFVLVRDFVREAE